MRWNNLTSAIESDLLQSLSQNPKLLELRLKGNRISETTLNRVTVHLQRNEDQTPDYAKESFKKLKRELEQVGLVTDTAKSGTCFNKSAFDAHAFEEERLRQETRGHLEPDVGINPRSQRRERTSVQLGGKQAQIKSFSPMGSTPVRMEDFSEPNVFLKKMGPLTDKRREDRETEKMLLSEREKVVEQLKGENERLRQMVQKSQEGEEALEKRRREGRGGTHQRGKTGREPRSFSS